MNVTDFIVARHDLGQCKAVETESRGPEAVRRVYLDTLNGRIPPEQGHMLSLLG